MSAPHATLRPGFALPQMAAVVPCSGTPGTRLRATRLADFAVGAGIMCKERVIRIDGPFAREASFLDFGTSDAGVAVFRHWGVSGT